MAKIIDLGNGYGRIKGYRSRYASLTFPLTLSTVRKLHAREIISDDEANRVFSVMGYEPVQVKWLVALGNVTTEQWRKAVDRAGTT